MDDWEIEARLKIRELVDKNQVMYDSDRFVEAYSVYAEDAVLVSHPPSRPRYGRADMLERFTHRPDGRLGDYTYTRHNMTTQYIESLTPDSAVAYSYYHVFCDGALSTAGVFHDDFARIDGEWLITRRRVLQDITIKGPTLPDTPPPLHAPVESAEPQA